MENTYKNMMLSAEDVGIKILSDDYCCKLLAWVYVFGGANEAVIYNKKLNTDLLSAQKRLNLYGGVNIYATLMPLLQKYCKELEPYLKDSKLALPDWVVSIYNNYNMVVPKYGVTSK